MSGVVFRGRQEVDSLEEVPEKVRLLTHYDRNTLDYLEGESCLSPIYPVVTHFSFKLFDTKGLKHLSISVPHGTDGSYISRGPESQV